jgi:hypothetical protein
VENKKSRFFFGREFPEKFATQLFYIISSAKRISSTANLRSGGCFWALNTPLENVAQVRAAVGAKDFGTSAVGIGFPAYGAGYLVIKARPSAMRFEFRFGCV